MNARVRSGILGAVVLAAGALRAGEPAPCRVEASAEPPRAVVGEQVLYRVRIHSRDEVDLVEWSHPPAFPNLRTEPLPGDPQPAGARPGAGRVRDERRALFAERPGTHVLRAPQLRCVVGADVALVPVPEVRLEVEAPPAAGRPPDFDGQVGPRTLHLTVTPERLSLGGSVRVALMVLGTGNLFELAPPFAEGDFAGAEVFAQRPDAALERGRALFVRRHFVYDVVPRAAGALRVPALSLPWFDPETGAYRVARTEGVEVVVEPRAAPPPAPPAADTKGSRVARPPDAKRGTPLASRAWLAVAVLAAVAAGAAWWRARRRDPAAAALDASRAAAGDADADARAAALARALRRALTRHVEDAHAVAPEELLARPGLEPAVAAAAHLLAALERARFDPEAPPPDPEAVQRTIAEL